MRRIWLPLLIAASSALGAQAPVITKKLTIGCESCGGPDQFGSIWDVSISPRGEILVTDRDAPMLRRFDASGKPVWTGGRKGKGPGEFLLPIRAALTGRGITVVDMTNSRVTDLTDAGLVQATTTVLSMPMVATVNERGELWIGSDNFRGTLKLFRRSGSDSLREGLSIPNSKMNVGLAVGPDGSIAAMLDTKTYQIVRYDAQGHALAPIVRDVAQVRRTQAEEAAARAIASRARGMVAAEAKANGGSGSTQAFAQDELKLKDHLVIDGLRFDASGRLWVLTQRGNESSTVFDVFSPSGVFLGALTVPMKVTGYSLGGNSLATAGENEDGIPVVIVWTLK